jgi:flagellar biosynthesis/type III secretory pathway M-ring protein FliF/YscJ
MNVLEGMISQMSSIERAKVVLDPSEGSGALGRANVPSSASVSVRTVSGDLTQQQVDAIAHLVAHSHAGLKPENVAIIDSRSGRSLRARDKESVSISRYLEVKQAAEKHAKGAIAGALDFIPGVLIQVNAQVNATEELQQTSSYEDPKLGVTNESSRTLNSTMATPNTEPAVRPNTGVNIAMGRNGSQMSDERNDTSSVPAFGRKESQIRDPKGYPLQINATIGVPRSYFVRLMQDMNSAATGPSDAGATQPDAKSAAIDPAELDAFVLKETDRLKLYVTPLIDTQAIAGAAAGTVTVSMVPDFAMPVIDEAHITNASSSMLASGVSGDLIKTVGLGGLALLSVAMMFLMVRRASSKPTLPTAQELVGVPPALAGGDSDLVGEADESAPALEGVELTDDAMRRQQMLDQIRSMISETPEEASNLLRRWVKSEA